jgi:hypothetical protein
MTYIEIATYNSAKFSSARVADEAGELYIIAAVGSDREAMKLIELAKKIDFAHGVTSAYALVTTKEV